MEINVVDTIDPALVKPLMTLRNMNKKVIEISPGPNGVGRMVDQIRDMAGCTGSITVLRIYAHGHDGAINVAGGNYNEDDILSTISLANLPKLKSKLSQLAPYFARGARVELQGCTVARGTDGEKFISELSAILGVRVQASPIELSVGAVQFDGPVYEAWPNGGLLCVPRTEITKDKTTAAQGTTR